MSEMCAYCVKNNIRIKLRVIQLIPTSPRCCLYEHTRLRYYIYRRCTEKTAERQQTHNHDQFHCIDELINCKRKTGNASLPERIGIYAILLKKKQKTREHERNTTTGNCLLLYTCSEGMNHLLTIIFYQLGEEKVRRNIIVLLVILVGHKAL